MSQVYLCSYKGTRAGLKGLFNKTVRFFTKSIYSHSEISVGNPFDGSVLCVSSVGTEGGVRGKVMQLNPEKWDIVPLPVYPQQVISFLDANKGKPYDAIGCVRTILPFVSKEHETKYFCSEVVAEIAGYPEPWRMHPAVLHMVSMKGIK